MKSKEQVFWFLSHNKMWCIPLCLAAFSLLPGSYTHAASIIDEVSNAMDLIRLKEIQEFNDDGNRTEARMGYLGRINYSYADKYLVELIARWDGSWKFRPDNRWGFFPSASLGWRVSEENF